jgi:hypothetical protein
MGMPSHYSLIEVRLRRSAADGGRCREGPLTDPIADAQACLWELVFMPETV